VVPHIAEPAIGWRIRADPLAHAGYSLKHSVRCCASFVGANSRWSYGLATRHTPTIAACMGRSCHRSNRPPSFRGLMHHMVLFPFDSEGNLMTTQAASELAKQVILIVDDDDSVRNSLRNLMESEGFAVYAFSNGQDLLNEASLPAIGCLVVDYQMPAMNGLELVGALRGRGVSVPAILITGSPTSHVRNRAAAMAVLVVEKPELGSYLLECVREAVAKHGQPLS
jgi:two-component system, LuxR family, response regulator FixJ